MRFVTRTSFLALLALFTTGCTSSDPSVDKPELRLVRSAGGRIGIELVGGERAVAALQVELTVDGSTAFTLDEPAGPTGVPLDTVRLAARGVNRAVLFAGDTRGVALPRAGVLASFAARPATEPGASGELQLASAVVSDATGARIEVTLGPSIAVR